MNEHIAQTQKAATPTFTPVRSGLLQHKYACDGTPGPDGECAECRRKHLQRRATNQAVPATVPPIVNEVPRSPGRSLDANTRALMEPRFGHDFGRVRVHSTGQAATVPSAPLNEFEDCPEDWQRKANAALVTARQWVANVVTGLANLPYPFPAPVARLLNRHFRITGRGYVYEVRRHYNTIYAALNSPIDFECEKKCDDNVAAYVYSIWSDVHLCPIWYGLSPAERANTIIHEIAHDAADRDDEAYIWQPEYSKLSVEDAIDNADSYSNFAQEAYGP